MADIAIVPMGGDGLDERFFATVERVRDHGGDQWWLHIDRCTTCGQNWMIAQEERIYDGHFLKRLRPDQASAILDDGRWPAGFLTYEAVLRLGSERSRACVFFDPLSPSLRWTVEDLRRERPEISVEEIADLVGVPTKIAAAYRAPMACLAAGFDAPANPAVHPRSCRPQA